MIDSNILLELLQLYFIIAFIFLVSKTSQIKLVEVMIDSKKSGARGRNLVNNYRDNTKKSLKLVFVWPVFIYTYIRDEVKKRKLKNPKA